MILAGSSHLAVTKSDELNRAMSSISRTIPTFRSDVSREEINPTHLDKLERLKQ